MITINKLNEYKEYNGFYDGFYQQKIKEKNNITSDEEWVLITNLIQDFQMIIKGQTSNEFAYRVEKKIIDNCDNEVTIKLLKNISMELMT